MVLPVSVLNRGLQTEVSSPTVEDGPRSPEEVRSRLPFFVQVTFLKQENRTEDRKDPLPLLRKSKVGFVLNPVQKPSHTL